MLERFLEIFSPIKSAIEASKSISKKQKELLQFSKEDLKYLYDCLDIFKIFLKATTKLQAEKYPTIQYIYPYIYSIRNKLIEKSQDNDLVSKS